MPPKYKPRKQRLNEMSLAELKSLARIRNSRTKEPSARISIHQTKKQLVRSLTNRPRPSTPSQAQHTLTTISPGKRRTLKRYARKVKIKLRDRADTRKRSVIRTLENMSPSKKKALERYSRTVKKHLGQKERAIAHHDRYGKHRETYNVLRQGAFPTRAADLITTMFRSGQDRDDAEKLKKAARLRASIANFKSIKHVEEKNFARIMRNTESVEGRQYHTNQWNKTRRKYDRRIKKHEDTLRSLGMD